LSNENSTSTDPQLTPCIHSDKPVTNAWAMTWIILCTIYADVALHEDT
jgi:hypothetical protein